MSESDEEQVDPTKQPEGDEEAVAAEQARDDALQGDEAAEAGATLDQELEQTQQRLLRVSADYQNYVRRSQQHVTDAREQQLMSVARSLLSVLDHFDRALEVDLEKTSAAALLEGMQIVRQELLRALEQHGVQRLDVQAGDEFDPMRHEALMRTASDEIEPNHVVDQLQPGYVLGDKTLRPAQVSLAEPASQEQKG